VNIGSKPILKEVWANVVYTPKENVKVVADPIFFLAGLTMNVKMGQSVVLQGKATVPANAGPDFRLVLGTGHYHTHTTRFTAYSVIDGKKEVIFEEFNPLHALPEPDNYVFDSVTKNQAPDEAARRRGASSGVVRLRPGDQIQWECAVTNDNVSPTSPYPYQANAITFANAVYTGEMCNMFGIYAPGTGKPWYGGDAALLASVTGQ
jgi:hypothetical protein